MAHLHGGNPSSLCDYLPQLCDCQVTLLTSPHRLTDELSQSAHAYNRVSLDRLADCLSATVMKTKQVAVLFSKTAVKRFWDCADRTASLNSRGVVGLLRLLSKSGWELSFMVNRVYKPPISRCFRRTTREAGVG